MPEGLQGQAHRRARPGRADRRRQVSAASSRSASRRCSRRSPSPRGRSSSSSTSCTPSSAPARPRARWTPATCSSRCWRAASCTASARPRSTSTASTSRRTRRWSGASSRCWSDEPSVEDTISILRGLKERYEVHHGVRIKDAALVAAAVLSRPLHRRPLPARQGDRPGRRGGGSSCAWRSTRCRPSWTRSSGAIMQLEIEREALKKEKDAASQGAAGAAREGAGRPARSSATRCEAQWQREKRGDPARSRELKRADRADARLEIEQAERAYDFNTAAELQYGKLRRAGAASCSRGGAQLDQRQAAGAAAQGGGRRGGHRRGRRAAGPASRSRSCSKARSRSCCSWRSGCTSAWSARTRRSRRSRTRCAARGPACRTRTGRSARSSSSGRPASARPSWRGRWPSSCSTTSRR